MSENSQLQEYQDALQELLSSGLPLSKILESLHTDPRFEYYRDYVRKFDPDMKEDTTTAKTSLPI